MSLHAEREGVGEMEWLIAEFYRKGKILSQRYAHPLSHIADATASDALIPYSVCIELQNETISSLSCQVVDMRCTEDDAKAQTDTIDSCKSESILSLWQNSTNSFHLSLGGSDLGKTS